MIPYGELSSISHALGRIEYQLKKLNSNIESFQESKEDKNTSVEFVDNCWEKDK